MDESSRDRAAQAILDAIEAGIPRPLIRAELGPHENLTRFYFSEGAEATLDLARVLDAMVKRHKEEQSRDRRYTISTNYGAQTTMFELSRIADDMKPGKTYTVTRVGNTFAVKEVQS